TVGAAALFLKLFEPSHITEQSRAQALHAHRVFHKITGRKAACEPIISAPPHDQSLFNAVSLRLAKLKRTAHGMFFELQLLQALLKQVEVKSCLWPLERKTIARQKCAQHH